MSELPLPEPFGRDDLVVFIGHSPDALGEANAIRNMELEIGREWERRLAAANNNLAFKKVRVWAPHHDSAPAAGGQDAIVNPNLDRANVALFVFKERIGETTWQELERCRAREARIPILALFPAKAPAGKVDDDLDASEAWTNVLRTRKRLLEDWNAGPDSKALQPITVYTDETHLQQIVLDQMKRAFDMIITTAYAARAPEPPRPVRLIGDNPDLSHDRRPVLVHSADALDAVALRRFLDRPLTRKLVDQQQADPSSPPAEQLAAIGYLTDGRPAFGPFLCFAPKRLLVDKYSSCQLQMVSYDDVRKASARARISLVKDNLLRLFDEGLNWLRSGSGLRPLGTVGTEQRDEIEIPEIVLREALANALVHRDYERPDLRDQPTRLEVFPDRVEITSYGNLVQPYLAKQLNSDTENRKAWRRNPLIAEIFQCMGHAELNASGVSRMRQEMTNASLGYPVFSTDLDEATVTVTLERPLVVERNAVPAPLAPRPGQLRAMISSTVADLREHRHVLFDVCLRNGFYPLLADNAQDDSGRLLEDADLFLGIYGWRYSPRMEEEFDRAVARGIPILAFLMNEEHPVKREMVERTTQGIERLNAFRERVRSTQITVEFKSAGELRTLLAESLPLIEIPDREETRASAPAQPEIAPSRIHIDRADLLVGREEELAALDAAWSGPEKKNVVAIVALGGTGKTSLVAHWATSRLQADDDRVERYFDWSFYRQGIRRSEGAAERTVSSDLFVKAALEFFGDAELAQSNASGWQKGERLAHLAGRHRTLLVLDGIEPLQDLKTGELRDEALRALLRGLAVHNRGLCVITTRQDLPELELWRGATAAEWKLPRLSNEAGATLLQKLGVIGTDAELLQVCSDVKGHALTLTLLGRYIADAFDGDVRKRDLVSLSEADYEETRGHAFRVIEAYERSFAAQGRDVELSILQLIGLFDRTPPPDVLYALRQAPAIRGLTDRLVGLSDRQWKLAVTRLLQMGLIEEQQWERVPLFGHSEEVATQARKEGRTDPTLPPPVRFETSVDRQAPTTTLTAHPLIREYFGEKVRAGAPEAWQAAHSRIFEQLIASVPYWPESLEGLQPLYHAIVHGCHAGRPDEAWTVLTDRIWRERDSSHRYYSRDHLGALGADLAAFGSFFANPWTQPRPELSGRQQLRLLHEVSFTLRRLGRFSEAGQAMQAASAHHANVENWHTAAITAGNVSELDITVGDIPSAIAHGEQSVRFARRSGARSFERLAQTVVANALHQAGREEEARSLFENAERAQAEENPKLPALYSMPAFHFCDLLLAPAERSAWRVFLGLVTPSHLAAEEYADVESRAMAALHQSMRSGWLLDIALGQLTLGRAALYRHLLRGEPLDPAVRRTREAVDGLRRAAAEDLLPGALLTHAWIGVLQGRTSDARSDLGEAQFLAERGPMPLVLADIHLHCARLLRDDTAEVRLQQARKLIENHGYLRRRPELQDAEGWIRR